MIKLRSELALFMQMCCKKNDISRFNGISRDDDDAAAERHNLNLSNRPFFN